MMNGTGSMMGGMGIFPVVFWILILVGVYFIIKSVSANKTNNDETPLDIINKRYAKGEIDSETYQRMKNELNGNKP